MIYLQLIRCNFENTKDKTSSDFQNLLMKENANLSTTTKDLKDSEYL